jgi:hypothetical protein
LRTCVVHHKCRFYSHLRIVADTGAHVRALLTCVGWHLAAIAGKNAFHFVSSAMPHARHPL